LSKWTKYNDINIHHFSGIAKKSLLLNFPHFPWDPDDAISLKNQWCGAPVLVEGVPLELTLPDGTWLVYPLDEACNRRAEKPLRLRTNPFCVGPEHKTLWYEIWAL